MEVVAKLALKTMPSLDLILKAVGRLQNTWHNSKEICGRSLNFRVGGELKSDSHRGRKAGLSLSSGLGGRWGPVLGLYWRNCRLYLRNTGKEDLTGVHDLFVCGWGRGNQNDLNVCTLNIKLSNDVIHRHRENKREDWHEGVNEFSFELDGC